MPAKYFTPADLTAEYLRSALDYDPETGVFTWKPRPGDAQFNAEHAGNRAGSESPRRPPYVYRSIGIHGVLYLEHRLAWLYVHGAWPPNRIDHINGDTRDNRIANLRPATAGENRANSRTNRNNHLGVKGVSLCDGKYRARLRCRGKMYELGTFQTIEEAKAVYAEAAAEHHGEFARID